MESPASAPPARQPGGGRCGCRHLVPPGRGGGGGPLRQGAGRRSARRRLSGGRRKRGSGSRGISSVLQRRGLVDLLVNSAGVDMRGVAVADMDLDQWRQTISTDLTGVFLTSRALVRGLRAAGKPGHIVNISSIHSTAVRAGSADYCAAKAGLDNLTRTMAIVELPDGSYAVYYTGVDAHADGDMLYATGPSRDRLEKRGVAMASAPSQGNVKEATVDRTEQGGWRLFYEYAAHDASLIGLATAPGVAGP
ncbi:SDR family NAD(P)-dependent oxidoreductase [Sphingomonas sp. 22176]|uniref:SDR family NAD(P)-dependent oxidoreductase n=1 Tax=Sphingomonas sp. 22176 TaxID=3453884 RepID=UPI003F8349F5